MKSFKNIETKNEKSKDYCKADLKQRVLFFITIFRLAIPAFRDFGIPWTIKTYSYFEKDCRKKCARDNPEGVIWDMINTVT